jgi:sugar/nucleoside kinase (ribokinase family)
MTLNFQPINPVDYVIIGHVTQDLTPDGPRLGGTASYSSLTARALGLRVGIVTACSEKADLSKLDGITVAGLRTEQCTTFENIQTPSGRIQYLHHRAPIMEYHHVPESWRKAPIIHLGPIAQEIDPNLARSFPNSIVGLTIQGWLRAWDNQGRVSFSEWPEAAFVMNHSTAAVVSIEDVRGNEKYVEELTSMIKILVVTEGPNGARLYWNGDVRRFRPPVMEEVDPTGAGDIFAAAFFYRLHTTRDPWEAARFATQIASFSVTRKGLDGVPTPDEVQSCLMQVIPK